ncbi:unnamed protein product, partial [marine sediment metagenome]
MKRLHGWIAVVLKNTADNNSRMTVQNKMEIEPR